MDVFNAFSMFITVSVTLKVDVKMFDNYFLIKIYINRFWYFICWYSIKTGKEEKNVF